MFVRVLVFATVLLSSLRLFAADLAVKVVDPQSAVVPGAHVFLSRPGKAGSVALQLTTSSGVATFSNITAGTYRIRVLAPGFAEQNVTGVAPGGLQVRLYVAVAGQNVFG